MKNIKRLVFIFFALVASFFWYSSASDPLTVNCSKSSDSDCSNLSEIGFEFRDRIYYPVADKVAITALDLGLISYWSLANAYEEGLFVKQSSEKAFKFFRKLANTGNVIGQYAVGYAYSYGIGVKQNYEAAEAWLKLSANKGDPPSQRELAKIYMLESFSNYDYDKAYLMASLAVDQKDLDAYIVLAALHEQGKGIPVDIKKAFYWWKRSADEGLFHGIVMTGLAYQNAKGVKRDYSQAVYWFQQASSYDYSDATYHLGLAYLNGMGISKSNETGLSLIMKAAKQDNYIAQYYLGKAYLEGINVSQDTSLALEWFKRAEENGSADATVELALMHLNGQGIDQDLDKALNLLSEAAAQGSYNAAYILGRIYLDNLWVEVNYELALKWLTEAADSGSTNATISLVKNYTSNKAMGIDHSKAKYWLETLQNSYDEDVKLKWASLAIGTIKDKDLAKDAYEYLLEAKSRDVAGAYGELSWIYRTGVGERFGIPKNEKRAFETAQEGALLFDMGSFYELGLIYEFGSESTEINHNKSQEAYVEAVNHGALSAKFRLGISYLNHSSYSTEHALSLINDSAKEGLKEAYAYLGWIYENGYYVEQDTAIAIKFYRAAAEDLYEHGQYRLSVLLRNSGDTQEQLEGLTWLERAAYGGHSEAQFDLSLHLVDEEIDESRTKAVEWAKLSAASGNPRGISMLAWLLGEGLGTLRDIKRSRSLFKESAKMGDPYSQYMYGRMKFEGNGIPQDVAAGRELLVKACDARNRDACIYLQGLDNIGVLRVAAEEGDRDSQFSLGMEYLYGSSVPRDIDLARKWLLSSAQFGHAEAQYQLGVLFAYEQGENPDYTEAFRWFQKAAEQGNTIANLELGYLYEHGFGVEQSYSNAHRLYGLAAATGNAIAQHNMGLLYRHGRGVERNDETANEWFLKAAQLGDIPAQIDIGFAYERGIGVRQDYIKARKWYELAAEQGSPIAQHNIGLFYANGRGVGADETTAIDWFYMSAKQNYPPAQASLGFGFQEGRGVKQDIEEAIRWYRLASKQGNRFAKQNLWAMGVDIPPERLCRPFDSEAKNASCNVFKPNNEQSERFSSFLSQALKDIMSNYEGPRSDGQKYYGEVSFCLNQDGTFSRVNLRAPSGSGKLDQAILEAINTTDKIRLPNDDCIKKRASSLKVIMHYDETDMLPNL